MRKRKPWEIGKHCTCEVYVYSTCVGKLTMLNITSVEHYKSWTQVWNYPHVSQKFKLCNYNHPFPPSPSQHRKEEKQVCRLHISKASLQGAHTVHVSKLGIPVLKLLFQINCTCMQGLTLLDPQDIWAPINLNLESGPQKQILKVLHRAHHVYWL